MGLPIIASFWPGGALSYLEQLCLRSFVIHGHRVILYSYDAPENCPDGVTLLEADRIFPRTEHQGHALSQAPWIVSDIFKYRLLSVQNVIWAGTDMLCLRPWDTQADFLLGWEKPGKQISTGVLRLPRFSRALAQLNAFFDDPAPALPWSPETPKTAAAALNWGQHGPLALAHFLSRTGEIDHALPQERFCPVPFSDRRSLLEPGKMRAIPEHSLGVQLWSRRLSRRIITHEGGIPDPASFLGQALAQYGIDPLRAPIPDLPPEGSATQEAPRPATPPKAKTPAFMPACETPPFQRAIEELVARTDANSAPLPPPPEPINHDKLLVLTSMKNEAPFILEWIAYHKAIGVTHFLVYTNDCTDNTNEMLDQLASHGLVTRIDNPWDPGSNKKPQHVALADAMEQPVFKQADWVLTIDVDEFVNIHVGGGTFAELFEACNDPNVISFTWKFFGNDGVDAYEDRPIMEQFTACAPEFIPKPRLGWGFKSMLHRTAPYRKIGVHRPLEISDEADVDKVRWVNGSGRAMPEMLLTNNGWRSTKRSLGYRFATLNHYILRSADSFLVKRDRGRINHTDQDQGIDYWMRRNYATQTDTRMAARLPLMETERAKLMADPDLARLHHDAVAWHRDKIAALKADPGYAALYHELTEIARPDAIYLAKPEDDETSDETIIVLPEPEELALTPDQAARKVEALNKMLEGGVRKDEIPEAALIVPADAPAASPPAPAQNPQTRQRSANKSDRQSDGQSGGQSDRQKISNIDKMRAIFGAVPDRPARAAEPARAAKPAAKPMGDPRYDDIRAAIRDPGFLWEGPENALYYEPHGKRLIVSFDNIHMVREEGQRWPWGHKFLTGTLGCSVLGVMGSKRNWFRADFVHEAFDRLERDGFFKQFDQVLFYGASMGGFGALSYARCAPGADVLAIAPQTTLDRRILPQDDRWGWTRKLDWDAPYADAAQGTALARDVVVISDPYFAPDKTQIARLAGDNIRRLKMPFFGHQIPNAFVNMGVLKPMLTDMLEGKLTAERFYALMRARRDLPRFQHDLIAQAEQRGHTKLAIMACEYTLGKRKAGNIRKTLERLQAEQSRV